jgi:hypothetical protein
MIIATVTGLSACNNQDKAAEHKQQLTGLPAVRAAIVARNYAEAADLARKEVASRPADPAAQFELARAEALAGNQGRAIDALDLAVRDGLADAARAVEDPAFDALRDDDRFVALVERAAPGSHGGGDNAEVSRGADAVQIHESAGGTHIRAGDVKLDTDF